MWQQKTKKFKESWYEMNKKNITIIVSVLIVAILVVLLILFGSKKKIEFDSQGGSTVSTQEVGFWKKAKKPANPTKEGYTFDNWYYDNDVYDFDTKVTKGITLKARWIKNGEEGTVGYTVTFNTNGGSSIANVNTNAEGILQKPADPTREGYKFAGWQLDGKDFDFSTKLTKNSTLTAKWVKDDSQPSGGEKTPKLNSGNFTLNVGKTKKLAMQNTTGKVTWKSSNTKVATVDSNGNVKAVAAGTAKITATVDGKDYTITVTVKNPSSGNQGGNTQTPTEPENPDKPVNPDPKPEKTYKASCEAISGSTVEQCEIVIRDQDGNKVNGTVRVELTTGGSGVLATGKTLGSKLFKSATVESVN